MPRKTKAVKQEPQVDIGAEIFASLRELEKLKGIPVDYMVERLKQARQEFKESNRRVKELLDEMARRRKNGEALEEITARLETAAAAMKERRAKLRELERKLRRQRDDEE